MITDELRAWILEHRPDGCVWCLGESTIAELIAIADRIDKKHEGTEEKE